MEKTLMNLIYEYIDTDTVQRKRHVFNQIEALNIGNKSSLYAVQIYDGLYYAIKQLKVKKYLGMLYDSRLINGVVKGYVENCKGHKDNRVFQNGYGQSLIKTVDSLSLIYGNEPELLIFNLFKPQIVLCHGMQDLQTYYKTTQKDAIYLQLKKNIEKTKLNYDIRVKVEKYIKLSLVELPVIHDTSSIQDYIGNCLTIFNNNKQEFLHYAERYLKGNELFYTHKSNYNKNNGNYYNNKLMREIREIIQKENNVIVTDKMVIPASILNYILSKTNEAITRNIVNELRKVGVLDKNKIDLLIRDSLSDNLIS